MRYGEKSNPNPWDSTSLEWQTPDLPPVHGNWGPQLPKVYRWAYDYSVPNAQQDFIPQNVAQKDVDWMDSQESICKDIQAYEDSIKPEEKETKSKEKK